MVKKNIITLLSGVMFAMMSNAVIGQKAPEVVYSSSSLDTLIAVNAKVNRNQQTIDGYRIQIYSGSGSQAKKEAFDKKEKMLKSFPAIADEVYVAYNAPFWRVRVGNFRDRCEALPLLVMIKHQFPGSYTVRDNTIKKNNLK